MNHKKDCTNHHTLLQFAFWQRFPSEDGIGVYVPYWHVKTEGHPQFNSTLSVEGMRNWGIIR